MRSGEEWVMLMTTGGLDVLRLKTMMVEVNDAGMLMAVEEEIDGGYLMMVEVNDAGMLMVVGEEIDGGCLMMVEGKIDVWRMKRMSGGGMRS